MNFSLKNIFAATALSIAVLIGCEGPVGPAGPDGAVGTDGANGADGNNGPNGANGVGYDELVSLGSITVTFSGTMPEDSIPFEKTLLYPFASVMEANSTTSTEENFRYFEIIRWFSVPEENEPQGNGVVFVFDIDEGAEPDTATSLYFNMGTRIIENMKYFELTANYDLDVLDNEISEYSFNPETGELSFHFDFIVPADYNSSGFDLTVTGDAEVIVLEDLLPNQG